MGLIFHTSPFRRQYILFSCRIGLIIEMHPMSICIHNQCFGGNRENFEMVCNHYQKCHPVGDLINLIIPEFGKL